MCAWSIRASLPSALIHTIKLPSGGTFQPEFFYAVMRSLCQEGKLIVRIEADYSAIRFQIVDLSDRAEAGVVKNTIMASYPQAEVITERYSTRPFVSPFKRWVVLFQQRAPFVAPIRYSTDLRGYDPLVTLTNMLSNLLPDERVTYSVYVGEPSPKLKEEGQKQLKTADWAQYSMLAASFGLSVLLKTNIDLTLSKDKYMPELQKIFEAKMNDVLYPCFVMVEIDAVNPERLVALGIGVEGLFRDLSSQFQYLGYYDTPKTIADIRSSADIERTGIIPLLISWQEGRDDLFKQVQTIFNANELASLWHLPYEDFIAPTIARVSSRNVRVPTVLRDNRQGVHIGDNEYAGVNTPVFMLNEDRATHMIITGRTQMGKSTLIHNLVHQDIAQGHGVAVIDPHGKLINAILRHSIPEARFDDVVLWDLANLAFPPPLNLLSVPDGLDRTDAASQIMKVFETLEKGFGETRMAGSLSDALEALVFEKNATLRDISRLFSDEDFRASVLANVTNPATFDFWDEFEEMGAREQRELSKPLNHRLRRLYKSQILYPIICHPDPLNFGDLIAGNKIILVSLQAARGASLSERELEFLGALMISQLQLAVMAEAAQKRFFVYIDEAERFVTTAVDDVFNQAAKGNLSMTLANQYLGQLEGKTLDAVMGNVGAMVFFQIGEKDARTIAPYTRRTLTVDDMVSLDAHRAAAIMRFNGQQLPAFTLASRPQPLSNTPDPTARIRDRSRAKYTPKSRDEVLAWLNDRYPPKSRKRKKSDEDFTDPE